MKKLSLLIILAAVSTEAFARLPVFSSHQDQEYVQGGFKGSKPGLTSVAQAKTFRDDAWVVLEGNIIRQIGHELYEFRDNSGSVYVDIDDKRWLGQSVSSNDKVRIEGEIDKDWNSVEIDVKSLRILK